MEKKTNKQDSFIKSDMQNRERKDVKQDVDGSDVFYKKAATLQKQQLPKDIVFEKAENPIEEFKREPLRKQMIEREHNTEEVRTQTRSERKGKNRWKQSTIALGVVVLAGGAFWGYQSMKGSSTHTASLSAELHRNNEQKLTEAESTSQETAISTDTEARGIVSQEAVGAFMDEYLQQAVLARNENNFSLVTSYLDPSGEAYLEEKRLIADYYKRNIKEVVLAVEVTQIEEMSTGYVQVWTKETYRISKNHTRTINTYENVYMLSVVDGKELLTHTVVDVKQVSSKEDS